MRARVPWTELSIVAAVYTAFAAWSRTGGAHPAALACLMLAVLVAALPRVMLRELIRPSLDRDATLLAAGVGAIAVATHAGGSTVGWFALDRLRVGATATFAGGSIIAALEIDAAHAAIARIRRLLAGLVAAAAVVATARFAVADTTTVAVALVAAVAVARWSRSGDPELRARFAVPAAFATLGATAMAATRVFTRDDEAVAIASVAAAFGLASAGVAFAVRGKLLDRANVLARVAVLGGIATLAGFAVGARTHSAALAAAVATAVLGALSTVQTFALARDRDRLVAACTEARERAVASERVEELVRAVLEPLRAASRDLRAQAEFWVLETEMRYRLDVSGAAHGTHHTAALDRALLAWMRARPTQVVFADAIRAFAVRRPELRALIELLDEHGAFAAVPLVKESDLVGVLLVPKGRRRARPRYEERTALSVLARSVADALVVTLAFDRARDRAARAGEARDEAERARAAAEADLARVEARTGGGTVVEPVGSLTHAWIAYSESMRAFETRVRAVATGRDPVLLVSEPGTSIAAVARVMHEASDGASDPCVLLDAGTMHPRDALIALVGSSQATDPDDPSRTLPDRAGWLELAGRGTIALIDVPALPPDALTALAETMRSGTVRRFGGGAEAPFRARLVATARGIALGQSIPADLAERLARTTLRVPPLRERAEDLEALVLFAIDRACRVLTKTAVGIRRDAFELLRAYAWPGNEVELYETMSFAVQRARGPQITVDDLPSSLRLPAQPARASVPPADGRDADGESYDALERRILQSALERAGGNKSEAARALGLARTTFLDKLRKYGLRA